MARPLGRNESKLKLAVGLDVAEVRASSFEGGSVVSIALIEVNSPTTICNKTEV